MAPIIPLHHRQTQKEFAVAAQIVGKKGRRPVSRVLCEGANPSRQPFLWARSCPRALATYPQAWPSRPQALAYLVLLRMEVARFTPPVAGRTRLCGPVRRLRAACAAVMRAGELPRIPLCGARTFLCVATAAAWPSPGTHSTRPGRPAGGSSSCHRRNRRARPRRASPESQGWATVRAGGVMRRRAAGPAIQPLVRPRRGGGR